jgi:Ca2+-binding RTX toxin-like protein
LSPSEAPWAGNLIATPVPHEEPAREKEIEMNKKITIAVAGLAVSLLVLTPVAAQADSSVSVSLNGSTIQVLGDTSNNDIQIADQSDPMCPGGSPCYEIRSTYAPVVVSAPCVAPITTTSESRALCPASGVTQVTAFGREGTDRIVASDFVLGLAAHVDLEGGPDNDQLQGSSGADTLRGNEGNDAIEARDGNDLAFGNSGSDRIYGGKGTDMLAGGAGFDNLIGGLGNDRLFGNAGNDGMDGAQGFDRCVGGKGRNAPRHCERIK